MAGGVSLNVGYTLQINPDTCASISSITADLHFQGMLISAENWL